MAENKERRIDQINSKPGFGRDGTQLDTPSFVDGQWCRFQRARPKKIGGYQEISGNATNICRGAFVYSRNGLNYLYGFSRDKMWVSTTTQQCSTTSAVSSTFASYSADREYNFQVDSIYDAAGSGITNLVIHGADNIQDIASEINTPIYSCTAGVSGAVLSELSNGEGGTVEVS